MLRNFLDALESVLQKASCLLIPSFAILTYLLGLLYLSTNEWTAAEEAALANASTRRSVLADYNASMAVYPAYREINNEGEAISTIDCAAGGRHPFLMHQGFIAEWVCDDPGERKVTAVMLRVFEAHCNDRGGGLMLDVGANHGYYGLLAMKMGCRSLFFDLQPECQQMINNAIIVNNFTDRGRVFPYGVSNSEGVISVSESGCDGMFPVSAKRQGTFDKGNVTVELWPLTQFIGADQRILLMKIDTEGNERRVLESAMPYFERSLARNAIVEVTPGYDFWRRAGISREQVASTFSQIANFGYAIVSLHDFSVHVGSSDVYNYFLKEARFGQSGAIKSSRCRMGRIDQKDI